MITRNGGKYNPDFRECVFSVIYVQKKIVFASKTQQKNFYKSDNL